MGLVTVVEMDLRSNLPVKMHIHVQWSIRPLGSIYTPMLIERSGVIVYAALIPESYYCIHRDLI